MPTPPVQHRFPCESCGASLSFAPGEHALTCPYCGQTQPIPPGTSRAPSRQHAGGAEGQDALLDQPGTGRALQWDGGRKSAMLEEVPLARGLSLDRDSTLTRELRTLSCPNCGARFELDNAEHAATCPYCATPVVTDTGAARQIKPQAVLPFAVTQDDAHAALEDWLGRLWFAPSGLTAYARRGRKMVGIYSPYWTFDADTQSRYHGQRGDFYYETRMVTVSVNGRPERRQERVRKTRWTPVSGQVARHFNDVLVLASASLPRRLTDALTPWDLSHLTAYDPRYLAGMRAESYAIALADGHAIARQEMAGVIQMDVRRDIGGDVQRVSALETRHSDESFKHILLPIWSAAYKYNGKSYRFVVNGQSGRVQGERPWSIWKIAGAVLAALLVMAALAFLAERNGMVDLAPATSPNAGIPQMLPDGFPARAPPGFRIEDGRVILLTD